MRIVQQFSVALCLSVLGSIQNGLCHTTGRIVHRPSYFATSTKSAPHQARTFALAVWSGTSNRETSRGAFADGQRTGANSMKIRLQY